MNTQMKGKGYHSFIVSIVEDQNDEITTGKLSDTWLKCCETGEIEELIGTLVWIKGTNENGEETSHYGKLLEILE
jgi:hypothetical protein